jgi:lipopolysaccharide transport system permease protein
LDEGKIVDMNETQTELVPIKPPSVKSVDSGSVVDDTSSEVFELVLYPRSGWIAIDWKELWAYRELLWFLVWRDIAVRYKQTVLGSAWAILQPLVLMLIFTVIFGRFGKMDSQGLPYPVFVFASLVPWTMFSQGFPAAGLSLVNSQQLLTKVYFPRIYVPVSAACVFLVDLFISLGLYALVLFFYRVTPSWTIVFLPLLILLTLIATLGFGLLLSALTVLYRDFKHVVPFMVQIMLYITPVIYPAHLITWPLYRWILSLNPMFGLVTAYRSCILGLPWDFPCLAISTVSALTIFLFGVFYFRRTERYFADVA